MKELFKDQISEITYIRDGGSMRIDLKDGRTIDIKCPMGNFKGVTFNR